MHLANHKTGEEIHFHYRADNRMGCERYIPRLGLKRCIVSLTSDASDSLVELSLHDDDTFKVEGCEIVMSDMVGLGPFSIDDIKIVI